MSVYEQRRPCSAGRGLVHKAGKRVQPCLCYGKKRSPSAIFLGRTPTLFLISSKLRILRRSNIFLMRYTSSSVCSNRGAKRKTIRWSTRVISCRLSRRNCGNTRGFPVFPWCVRPASGKFQRNFQYDILHPVLSAVNTAEGASCPLETHVIARNVQMFLSRLPKNSRILP